jgi:hypothetical protein
MANSKWIPPDPEKKARSRIGIFSIIMVLLVASLMLLEAMGGAAPAQSNQPATQSASIQPNPTLNTNITWSTFYNGWSPLEYYNGSGNQTLNAELSSIYTNPISINTVGLQSTYLTNSNATGTPFNSSNLAVAAGASGGSVQTTSYANGIYTLTQNTSASSTNWQGWKIPGPVSDTYLPSNNPQYDYVTVAFSLLGPAMTGVSAGLSIWNSTGHNANVPNTIVYPGQSIWESAPLSNFAGPNFNTTVSTYIVPELELSLPEHASTTYTIKLTAFMITTAPLYLGNNISGPEYIAISPHFSSFNPDFSWQDVDSSGYSVAISQPLQNLTATQTPISSGNYSEEVEYQGQFNLPTAPDLSYGATNITEDFAIPTSQTQVLDINGVSYLSTINGKNSTITLLASVNPNEPTQFLQIVDYTQTQWTSISSPPGIFTIQGIEYYWEEFIIAILAVVGLGAGAASKHASSLRKVK